MAGGMAYWLVLYIPLNLIVQFLSSVGVMSWGKWRFLYNIFRYGEHLFTDNYVDSRETYAVTKGKRFLLIYIDNI